MSTGYVEQATLASQAPRALIRASSTRMLTDSGRTLAMISE